ncbi:DUF3383 family protein [Salibacterium sp. K-3]
MAIKDWTITVSRETRALARAGFGMPLILATNADQTFTKYSDIDEVQVDFDDTTEAYAIANRIFKQRPRPQEVAILGVSYEAGTDTPSVLTDALDGVEEDFYFLVSDQQTQDEVVALSDWAEGKQKMYGASVDDPAILDAIADNENTFVAVHDNPTSYPVEGWIGRCAPEDPGSITWNYKHVEGIEEGGTDVSDIKDRNGNSYIEQHGELHMYDGRTASGEWIDVIRSQHYLYTRIDENIFLTLSRADKVPYTNAGIAMIESAIESAIKEAANNGMVATNGDGEFIYNVSVPTRADTTTEDRANRILPDIQASVTIAGAIHGGDIDILVQV